MNELRYTINEYHFDSIPLNFTGLYTESIILNYTNSAIYVIDKHDVKTDIPAQPTPDGRLEIEIRIRSINGARTSDPKRSLPKAIPGKIIKINRWEIESQPVYIAELDILICSATHIADAKHPYHAMDFREIIDHTIQQYQDTDRMHTLRVFANTEDKELSELYVNYAGNTIRVEVTHNVGYSEIAFVLSHANHRRIIKRIDISKFDQGIAHPIEGGNFIFIAKTDFEISMLQSQRHGELSELIEFKEKAVAENIQIKNQIEELHKLHEADGKMQEAKSKHALEKKQFELQQAQHELTIAKDDNTKQKIQLSRYEGLIEADTFAQKQRSQANEADNKAKSAAIGLDSDVVKYRETCIKVSGAIVLFLVGILVKSMFETYKATKV